MGRSYGDLLTRVTLSGPMGALVKTMNDEFPKSFQYHYRIQSRRNPFTAHTFLESTDGNVRQRVSRKLGRGVHARGPHMMHSIENTFYAI